MSPAPASSVRLLYVNVSMVPLYSLSFQQLLHSGTDGAYVLIHPIELDAEQLKARLLAAKLEDFGVEFSMSISNAPVPTLTVVLTFKSIDSGLERALNVLERIVLALCQATHD